MSTEKLDHGVLWVISISHVLFSHIHWIFLSPSVISRPLVLWNSTSINPSFHPSINVLSIHQSILSVHSVLTSFGSLYTVAHRISHVRVSLPVPTDTHPIHHLSAMPAIEALNKYCWLTSHTCHYLLLKKIMQLSWLNPLKPAENLT